MVKESREKFSTLQLDTWVLSPVRTTEDDLSEWVCGRLLQLYNRRQGTRGVWQKQQH